MLDSVKTQGEMLAGIPDAGVRITALIIVGFVVAILVALLYLRMKEYDDEKGVR